MDADSLDFCCCPFECNLRECLNSVREQFAPKKDIKAGGKAAESSIIRSNRSAAERKPA